MKLACSSNLFLIFLVPLFLACTEEPKQEARIGIVQKQTIVQKVSLNGKLRGLRETQVRPGYSGYIGNLYVKVGDKVKEGQPLVRVRQTMNQPDSEVFPIVAPFAGTVTQILSREGEYVTSAATSTAIMVVNDLREIWVDTNVPEVDIAKVSLNLEAEIKANAIPRKKYKGIVKGIALSPRKSEDRWDRGRVEYPTEIRVENPDEDLKPGLTVVVDVISAKAENVIAVKHEFIHRDDNGYYLVDKTGARHAIKTGLSNDLMIEVTEGATEGLEVQMVDFGKL